MIRRRTHPDAKTFLLPELAKADFTQDDEYPDCTFHFRDSGCLKLGAPTDDVITRSRVADIGDYCDQWFRPYGSLLKFHDKSSMPGR